MLRDVLNQERRREGLIEGEHLSLVNDQKLRVLPWRCFYSSEICRITRLLSSKLHGVYIEFIYVNNVCMCMYIHTILLFHPKQLNHWVPQLFGSADTKRRPSLEPWSRSRSRWNTWRRFAMPLGVVDGHIYDYCIDVGVCIYIYIDIDIHIDIIGVYIYYR